MDNLAIIMIIHYTYGWTQDCVQSFLRCTDRRLIVFDNNPLPNQFYRNTRKQAGYKQIWSRLCEQESFYVRKLDRVQVVNVPKPENDKRMMTHGEVLEMAFRWCKSNGYNTLLHIEPDSKVSGGDWIGQMEDRIRTKWAVGQAPYINRDWGRNIIVISLCPTMWRIDEILNLNIGFEKDGRYNTGQKILEICRDKGMLDAVETNQFEHLWHGSRLHHKSVLDSIGYL